jgi:hypothetical protein
VTDQFRVQITSSSWSDSRIQSSFDTSCASLFSSATLERKRRHAVHAHLGLKLLETITLDFASGAPLGCSLGEKVSATQECGVPFKGP